MERVLLNSTQAAKRVNMSAADFNELLYSKEILNKRGRRSIKNPKVFKPFWDLIEPKYGKNFPNNYGGNSVMFYSDTLEELFIVVGLGGMF